MKYYVCLHTPKDRCGCRNTIYRIIEANTKTEIRKKYKGTGYGICYIWTEEEVEKLPGRDTILRLAK